MLEVRMIDWQRVGELRSDIGAEDFADVVDLFLEEVADVVARLTGAKDPNGYEAELHLLKGTALNLGFSRLGELCADGERLARDGRGGEADIDGVIVCYEASLAEFTAGLEQSRAA